MRRFTEGFVLGLAIATWLLALVLLCTFLSAGMEAYAWESLLLVIAGVYLTGVQLNNLMNGTEGK
jgi:hypothetical protein